MTVLLVFLICVIRENLWLIFFPFECKASCRLLLPSASVALQLLQQRNDCSVILPKVRQNFWNVKKLSYNPFRISLLEDNVCTAVLRSQLTIQESFSSEVNSLCDYLN